MSNKKQLSMMVPGLWVDFSTVHEVYSVMKHAGGYEYVYRVFYTTRTMNPDGKYITKFVTEKEANMFIEELVKRINKYNKDN